MLPDVGMVKTYSKSANVLTCSGGFLPVGFAMPHRFALHNPYICPCFCGKHFYIP